MAFVYEKSKPLVKREPTIVDVTDKILRFGLDNLYPQRAEEVLRRSSTLQSLTNRIADFINGEGFADERLAGKMDPLTKQWIIPPLVVNKKGLKGQTANKLLGIVSHPYMRYKSVPVHVGYNMLGGICALNPLPFESIRFGLRNKLGAITHLAYSANWERDSRSSNSQNIRFYPKFNPDPAIVLKQIEEAGGIVNYRGQIMYLTPVDDQYPLATFDSVYDDAQVQNEIGLFKIANVQQSFLATLAIVYPGPFSSDQEKDNFYELVQNKTGVRNAGTRIGIQDPTGTKKASEIFQTLSPENLDKLYEYTETSIKKNIIESEAFPEILLGKSATGLFAQGDMEEAYTYVNSMTRNRRTELSEIFSMIFSYWETPIITDAAIIEQRYIRNSGGASAGKVDINDNLKGMTGSESINFARILRKYSQGTQDRATTETLLRGGFGLSEEEIKKLLDGIDQVKVEEGNAQQQEVKVAQLVLAAIKNFKS